MVTQSDFWNKGVDEDKILGGPARVLVSRKSVTTYPELISEVLNLTTYDPATNWLDVGHTSEPFNMTDGFETTEWISQQAGRINVQVGNWNRTISVTLMQTLTNTVMDLAHEADGRTTNADGNTVEYFWDKPEVTKWRVAAIHLVEDASAAANIVMDVFPFCKRSGADSETAWDRGNPQTASLEMTPLPDEDVPYNANWYRIREL
jgi:hypothetical protein